MHYIIDGHNLIGQCRTIRLTDPDDEARLVDYLHRWVLRHHRHRITVVFDGGVYGHPQALEPPGIRAVFARSPQDADERLIRLIDRVTEPRQYRVVTSDRSVATVAHARQIEVIRAERFAAQLEQPTSPARSRRPQRPRPEPKLSKAEVDRWLKEFGVDSDEPAPDA
ncbi:MAG TPA: NYN domain-containing protein [Herpetosiphonaceae bacterium]